MLDLKTVHNLVCREVLLREGQFEFIWLSVDSVTDKKYLVYLSDARESTYDNRVVWQDTVAMWEISDEELSALKSGATTLFSFMDRPFALFEVVHASPDLEARAVTYHNSVRELPVENRPSEDATLNLI